MEPKRITRSRSPGVNVTARVIRGTPLRRADVSRQVDSDNSIGAAGSTVPIPPPFDLSTMLRVYSQSNMLGQCVEAYVTNIGLCGFEVAPVAKDVAMDPDEVEELQSFIDNANSEQSLTAVHATRVSNFERVGHDLLEVIRDRVGRVSLVRTVEAGTMLLCPKNEEEIPVRYDILRGKRTAMVTEIRTFRIYRQQQGGKIRYFKEFGDPRTLDFRTGLFHSKDTPVPKGFEATEILHMRQESDDAYGTPRWLSQLPSILGSRESEEVNLRYFEDNTVPPMILSVSGGRLTGESFRELKRLLNQQNIGKERQNKILLVEAVPERESLDDKGSVQLKVDKLTDARQSDGLFKDYDDANQAKVRSSFRLPPASVGLSQDVTFATANVSQFIAETQVYAPQRKLHDEFLNKRFVNHPLGLGLRTVCLRSMTPAITNPEALIKSLTALNVMGAITPRKAVEAANRILQIDIAQYPEKGEEGYEEWMDKPIIFATKTGSGNEGIDPATQGGTHDGQGQKDEDTKNVEDTGDVSLQQPENGSQ